MKTFMSDSDATMPSLLVRGVLSFLSVDSPEESALNGDLTYEEWI